VTVSPVAVKTSAMVTSMHASTFEISVALGLGVGEGLGEGDEEVEDVLEEPHALTNRPATATRAISPLVETLLTTTALLTSGP
jgi:hypothetical protein